MDFSTFDELYRQLAKSLNNQSAGPLTGLIGLLIAGARIAEPLLKEWLASRREGIKDQLSNSITYKALHEETLKRILINEQGYNLERAAWGRDKASLMRQIEDLQKTVEELKSERGKSP